MGGDRAGIGWWRVSYTETGKGGGVKYQFREFWKSTLLFGAGFGLTKMFWDIWSAPGAIMIDESKAIVLGELIIAAMVALAGLITACLSVVQYIKGAGNEPSRKKTSNT